MKAYKVELDPNDKQKTLFARCCGASRFVYNWGLAEWKRQYDEGGSPSEYSLSRYFNSVKDDVCPWIRELPYKVSAGAFSDLGKAFKNFFNKNADFPKFKRRRQGSFHLTKFHITNRRIRLTGAGWVVLKEHGYIPNSADYGTYATVSERSGRWYVSVLVRDENDVDPIGNGSCLGLDFGLKSLAVCSDGTVYENPNPLAEAHAKLSRMQRELSRRTRGGQNWKKTKLEIQRQFARVANIRRESLDNISHDIIVNKHPAIVAIEDLNVEGMIKNHCLAKAISDVGWGELRRQIEYKAKEHGVKVVIVDRWFPSSKMCSQCGAIKEDLTLSDRIYKCDCDLEIDRDLNAAINLAAYGVKAETQPDCLGS